MEGKMNPKHNTYYI